MARTTDHETIASRLAEIVGATHVSAAPADVDAYGGLQPLLVVWPGAASEVARVLRTCTELDVAVGVSASGTRATRHWPVQGERPRIALDTRRMLNILEVDELSLTVHSQCGIQLRHLEEALNRHGLTLGPYPPTIQRHTLGGILAAPHPAAHSPQTGRLIDACMGVSVAHADGSVAHTRVAPRRATGPDVARLYLGSRGALGVITTAVLKVRRQPEHEVVVAYVFPGFVEAMAGARECLTRDVRPARLRVLGAEQAVQELGQTQPPLPAVMLAVLSGAAASVAVQEQLVDAACTEAGGTALPAAVGSRWWARHSAFNEGGDEGPGPSAVPAPVRHSDVAEAVAAIPPTIKRKRTLVWADQITLQGATLWIALREQEGASRAEGTPAPPERPAGTRGTGVGPRAGAERPNILRAALLDAGLDPLRLNFPPLIDELRRQLDPTQTLVVMEA
jgi:alkyldihydroxyacetonephosphate synthase